MADPLSPPSEDPFAQIFGDDTATPQPHASAAPAPTPPDAPAANDNGKEDPFAFLGEIAPGQSSTAGAFARGAERSAIPAATGLVGAGLGGAGVVAAGAAAGTTIGPWGTLAGGVAGAIAGGYLGGAAQDWVLKRLPDTWVDALGMSDRQQRLDEAQHSMASFLGGLAPYAVTMKPSLSFAAKELPENATALQKIMANPATARLFGGAAVGGMELGQEAAQGHVDWSHVAISTAFGVVFNEPNFLGKSLTGAGERVFRPGEKPTTVAEKPVTVAQADDANVMGAGNTEDVYQGSHERAPAAAMAAQQKARDEQAALGEVPEPDVHAVAKQMHPELFDRYDELLKRRDLLSENPEHLATTNAEIEAIQPDITAAYRRAAETTGIETVEPEPFKSFADMLAARERDAPQSSTPELPAASVEHNGGNGYTIRSTGKDKSDMLVVALNPDHVAVRIATVAKNNRGTGVGMALYEKAIEFAGEHGVPLRSDRAVSADATHVWDALKKRGYTVTEGPDVRTQKDGSKFGAGYVYEVQPKERASNVEARTVPQVPAEPPLPQESAVPGMPGVPAGGEAPGQAGKPVGTAGPVVSGPQRSIGEQKAFIADDVARKLVAAGRPEDEARAAGQMVAHRYATRAGRFEGKLGTPEELYRKQGAAIAGANGKVIGGAPEPKPQVEPAKRGPAARDENTFSLLEFLASRGGIRSDEPLASDLRQSFGGGNKFVPGFGQLIRDPKELSTAARAGGAKSPMTLDNALKAAVDAGYLREEGHETGGVNKLTPNDLLDMIDKEARGNRRYKEDFTPESRTNDEHFEAKRDELLADIEKHVKESGGTKLTDAERQRATELWHKEGLNDTADILERLALEADDAAVEHGAPEREAIPGWDTAHEPTGPHEAGKTATEARSEEPGGATAQGGGARETVTFKTAKGSSYVVHPDGTTTRNKAARSDAGHEGDFGPKARSAKTIYLDTPEMAGNLTAAGLQNLGPKGARVIIKDGKASLLTWNDAAGKWGIAPGQRGIPFSTEPAVGRAPLEVWKPANDIPGYEAYRGMHAGNPITEITSPAREAVAPDLFQEAQAKELEQIANKGFGDEELFQQTFPDKASARIELNRSDRLIQKSRQRYQEWADGGPRVTDKERAEWLDAFKRKQAAQLYLENSQPIDLDQTARGKIRLAWNGVRSLITFLKDANASTAIHEFGHDFLEQMKRDAAHPDAPDVVKQDYEIAKQWMGVGDDGELKTKHHEKFARGFEQYMREGVAPSKELAGVFAQFRNWLLSIYQSIKGLGTEISPEIRGVFDRMLEMEPKRTVIAPEERPMGGPALHEIHEGDAAHAEPHEAEALADRAAAERDRHIQEPPPEVAHEIAASVQKVEAEQAARAGTEPGAEAGESAGGQPEVGAGGGGPEPEPAGGGVGAGGGKVGESRGGAETEGAARPDSRSKLDDNPGTALAPGPVDLFGARDSGLVDKAGNIRLDNINTDENIKQVLRDVAAQFDGFIGDRRGKVTDGQVLHAAFEILGKEPDFFLHKKIGQAFNAEEIKAIEILASQSAKATHAAMMKAATGNDADVMAYAEARSRHQMIQAKFSQATAESGRAQRALRKTQELWSDEAKKADQIARESTGKTLFQLKAEAIMGATADTDAKVGKFMQDAQNHSFGRLLMEYFVNNLISGPATHSTYMVGNMLLLLEKQLLVNPTAAAIGQLRSALGREGPQVHYGETLAGLKGIGKGIAPALDAMVKAAKTGVTAKLPNEDIQQSIPFQLGAADLAEAPKVNMDVTFHDLIGNSYAGLRSMRDGLISIGEMVKAGGVKGAPLVGLSHSSLGHIADIQVRGMNVSAPLSAAASAASYIAGVPILIPAGGTQVRLSSRMVATIHTLFRVLNYSAEINQMAYRSAVDEGHTGNARAARTAELRQSPTQEMMDSAAYTATDLTMMGQSGEFMKRVSKLFNWETNLPILGTTQPLKFIDPFVQIAGQVVKHSVGTHTPLGLISPEIYADITGKNGNIAQDMATAKMLVGSVIGMTFAGLAAEGYMTGSGPSDPHEAALWRMKNPAHSVRIGDMWYNIHKLGPLGALASIAADIHDVSKFAEAADMQHAVASFMHAFTQNFLDEGFLKGPSDLMKAIEDSGRYGGSYVKNFLSSFTPYSVAMSQLNQDPYFRQTYTILDGIKAKIPGLSTELFPRRDIWGEPMAKPDAIGGRGVTAIYAQRMNNDPVVQAMLNLGIYPAPVDKKIRNVELTPQQYDDFARLAGRMTKMRLDTIVRSPDYQTWPDATKHQVIEQTIRDCRETAVGKMFALYKHIPHQATILRLAKLRGEKPK